MALGRGIEGVVLISSDLVGSLVGFARSSSWHFLMLSHQFATLNGDSYAAPFDYFLSLADPIHPDLEPLVSCIDVFSKVCNPNDPTLTTFDLYRLFIARPLFLVHEYAGSTNHILQQFLLVEF
jgi:hypothetical protein